MLMHNYSIPGHDVDVTYVTIHCIIMTSVYILAKSSDILNKNSLAVKKCEANQKARLQATISGIKEGQEDKTLLLFQLRK